MLEYFFELVKVVAIVLISLFLIMFFVMIGFKKWDEKLVAQEMEKVEAAIEDGYDVYLEGELKDAKTLDLSQYEISIDDENKIVKLTREREKEETRTNTTVVYPIMIH